MKEALKGSDAAAIKTASEKLNETWQVVSAELYKAASEKSRPGQRPAGGQSGTHSEADGAPEDGKKTDGPVIDAEVVDEKQAALGMDTRPIHADLTAVADRRQNRVRDDAGLTERRGVGLQVRGLRKGYNGHEVLKGIDFEVNPGEIFVIMGPSGCGKTVLLRQLIGLENAGPGGNPG